MDPSVNLYDELPSFANKENRELHAKILAKNAELAALNGECSEYTDRLSVIKEHLKNVQLEVSTTQQLLTAKEAEAEEEKHLQQLSLREQGKIKQELEKIENESEDINTKNSQVEAKTFKSQQRIEQFKEEAKMNEEELEQWVQAARDKEEDYLVLQRYQRDDESRVRSMLLEIEKATAIIESKKKELEEEITSTRALQIELDMTAEQFRAKHNERAQLLANWEQTLQKMQTLNEAIEKTTGAFEVRKAEVTKYQAFIQEGKKDLEAAELQNASYERKLTIGDNQVSQKHKQYEHETADLLEFEETVITQRHKLEKFDSDARAYQEEIDEFHRKIQQEIAKKEAFLKRLEETQNALMTQKDNTDELNDQTNVMNEFLKKEEDQLQALERAIDDEKNQIFKLSQEVYKARKQEKNLLAEMQGSQSRAKNLQLKIQEFDKETQKQEELLYNSNFQIQQMERKIARIEGDRTEEEKLELQTQIEQLSKILEAKTATEKILAQQLHRLELDLRQTSRKKDKLEKVQQDLDIRLTELRLDQDSLDKSTAKARTQKESTLVQINMLRLQVQKLSDQVNMKCDELISLENRRQQLQLSMEERICEIDSHLGALRVQLKTEEEARHQSTIELQERKRRADTLAAKYQVMMGKYKVEGEEVTQTYHVIKFAQEREEINRRGDELEEEVKQAIQELRALEKAMNSLNGQNSQFRGTFAAVGDNDADIERKNTLEEQRNVAKQRLNARIAEARSVAAERQAMEDTVQQRNQKISQIESELQKMGPQSEQLKKQLQELTNKLKVATQALTRAKIEYRKGANIAVDAEYPNSIFEMDVEYKMENTVVDQLVNELTNIAESNREIETKLNIGLSQIGIQVKAISLARPSTSKTPSITTPVSSRSGSSTKSGSSAKSNVSFVSVGSDLDPQDSARRKKSNLPGRRTPNSLASGGSSVRSGASSQASNRSGASGRGGSRPTTPRRIKVTQQPHITKP